MMRTRCFRRVFILLAALSAAACVSWRHESVPQSGSRAAERLPSQVRVATADGRTTTVRDPRIIGDTLTGTEKCGDGEKMPIRIALSDIRELESRRPDAGRSAAMALVVVFASLGLLAILLSGEET
jgi:hypothetical protein